MSKFISYEILTAIPLDYRHLYDESMEQAIRENESFEWSNIYFLCRLKKRRFDLDKTSIQNGSTLRTTIKVGNIEHKIETSIFKLFPIFENIPKNIQQYFALEIDREQTSEVSLFFLLKSELLDDDDFKLKLTVLNLEDSLNLDLNNYPEIVYIGQSFRIFDRVREHKTLGKAISNLNDSHEIIIYFINLQYGFGGKMPYKNKRWNFMLENFDRSSSDYKDKITLAERFLIYFYKPANNTQHINTELRKDKLVKNILLDSKIRVIGLSCAMSGNMYKFWSPNQALETELAFYDFEIPEKGFYENVDILDLLE